MINVLEESCTENQNTYFISNKTFPKICTIYVIKPNNMVTNEGTQMTSQHGAYILQLHWQGYMHLCACTHPHARTHARTVQYVILIAFPRQCASILRYTYIACLVESWLYIKQPLGFSGLILSHVVCIFTTVLQVAKFGILVACSYLTFHRPPLHVV
jgi:hypothetical protein